MFRYFINHFNINLFNETHWDKKAMQNFDLVIKQIIMKFGNYSENIIYERYKYTQYNYHLYKRYFEYGERKKAERFNPQLKIERLQREKDPDFTNKDGLDVIELNKTMDECVDYLFEMIKDKMYRINNKFVCSTEELEAIKAMEISNVNVEQKLTLIYSDGNITSLFACLMPLNTKIKNGLDVVYKSKLISNDIDKNKIDCFWVNNLYFKQLYKKLIEYNSESKEFDYVMLK
jgi:hypothetical protein